MACCLAGAKPLSKSVMEYCKLNSWEKPLEWNFYQNSYIFIEENAFENVVCELASILSFPQIIKSWYL